MRDVTQTSMDHADPLAPRSAADLMRALLAQRADLCAYVYAIARDAHLADDVFQEVAVVVLAKADEAVRVADLAAWTRAIARREALHQLRRRRRGGREHCLPDLEAAIDAAFAEAEPSPAALAEERAALLACLDSVGRRLRRVLELRFVEEAAYDAIARRCRCSVEAARQLVSRGRRALLACVRRRLRLAGGGDA